MAQKITNNGYKIPPHVALFDEFAWALAGRRTHYLILSVPPRHGKSEYFSKYFPAWYLGHFPTHRVILTSYEAGFARSWGRRTRDLLAGHGYLFGVNVREDVFAQDEWELEQGGGMVTAGVGGAITGKGANLIIVDDPHKNAEDALSETMREKVWEWWQSTLFTRREPDCVVIVIQTRWHTDDLTGKLLSEGSLPWEQIKLPALAEDDDRLGRAPGEPLWPERYDAKALAETRENIGSHWWAALYQQTPVPVGDTMYRQEWAGKWQIQNGILQLYRAGETLPTLWSLSQCRKFGVMDLAASTKQTADWTVLSSWLLTPHKDLILLDVDRRRLEAPDQPAMMRAAMNKWGLAFIGVESTAYQLSLVQHARRQGIPVRKIRADKDKIARALTGSAVMESGKMFWPTWAPWMPTFEGELYAFPTAPHDDQADTVAYAAIYASGKAGQGTFQE